MNSMDRCCTSDSFSGKHHCELSRQNKTIKLGRDGNGETESGKRYGFHFFFGLSFFPRGSELTL